MFLTEEKDTGRERAVFPVRPSPDWFQRNGTRKGRVSSQTITRLVSKKRNEKGPCFQSDRHLIGFKGDAGENL